MLLSSLSGLVTVSLLVSDLFIFLYGYILRFLNSHFSAYVSPEFIRSGAQPEPFEIFLYLSLTGMCLFFLWTAHLFFKNEKVISRKIRYSLYLSIFVLLLFFISNLGEYPMARSNYPYVTAEMPLTNSLFFYLYVLVSLMIILEMVLLSKIFAKNRLWQRFFLGFVLVLIAIVTFEPRFPIVGHDYSYFFGPVWEVISGKTLYTEVPSQYGFLSILLLALLHKLSIVSIVYLPALIWFLYIIQYFLCFYLLYRISRSHSLSLIGLFSIISVNYYSIFHLPASIPQIGPMRWLPLILALFVLQKMKRFDHPVLIIVVAISSFWVLDSGIALILAFGLSLLLLFLKKSIAIQKTIWTLFYLFVSLAMTFLTINLLQLLFGYQTISPVTLFSKFQQYAGSGFGMIPIETNSYFWFFILIYFLSITYFFQKRQTDSESKVILFSANLSLFAGTYFVGRSHPHNLFHVALFPLLSVFLLLGVLMKNRSISQRKRAVFFLVMFYLFVVFPIYNRQEVMTKMIKQKIDKFHEGAIFTPEWPKIIGEKYEKEIKLVRENISEDKIVILSPDDTYLFYLFNKKNLLYDNSQITILTKKDLDISLKDVFKACPDKIVADCALFNKCAISDPYTIIAYFSIQPILLERIQDVCGAYQPIDCIGQLCIARSK